MNKVLIFFIKAYKILVSPIIEVLFGKACRFELTCSEYTLKALEKYGAVKGIYLGAVRLSKCHI